MQIKGEIWKDVVGYEGLYKVSNFGRIKSCPLRSNHNGELIMKNQIITGYKVVSLCKNNKMKLVKVHRLVAIAFIDNPDNKPQVNHIDGNKLNNNVDNLEWVTAQENSLHAFRLGLRESQKGKENNRSVVVQQLDTNGNIKAEYFGTREAERQTLVNHSAISACCKGKLKSAGGWRWQYKCGL